MSDKNFDIDDILGESKDNIGDTAEKQKKSDVDEIDELLASLKNRPRRRINSEAEFDNAADQKSIPAAEPEAVIEESAAEVPEEKSKESDEPVIADSNDDIKKHFGKDNDIEDEFDEDEDEDEDEEEDVPVRRSSNKKSSPDSEFGSAKKRSGNSSGKNRRKKKGIGFNGSIFGGIILVTIIFNDPKRHSICH